MFLGFGLTILLDKHKSKETLHRYYFPAVSAEGSIPIKDIKAIPISPVKIKAIPNPRKAGGTFEYLIFSRIAAIAMIAKNQPNPPPKPKAMDSVKLYSRATMNKEPPRIAQFTVINGKKIPKEVYNAGEIFSTIISTSCTIEAITAIKRIKRKKVRSIPKIPFSLNNHSLIIQLIGIVIPSTKITASPRPKAVVTVLETAK